MQQELPELPESGPVPAAGVTPAGAESPERVTTSVQRIVRSTAVTRQVKKWHEGACQICSVTVILPGGAYSEGAHIQALGSPHNGPDTTDNVLCLCPTCHVMFDGGAIVLMDDLTIMRHGRNPGRCTRTRSTRSTWPALPATETDGASDPMRYSSNVPQPQQPSSALDPRSRPLRSRYDRFWPIWLWLRIRGSARRATGRAHLCGSCTPPARPCVVSMSPDVVRRVRSVPSRAGQ
ncbi:HNH endonuclease [Streptomyces sp. NPDC005722]